jgi:hypothetical protein
LNFHILRPKEDTGISWVLGVNGGSFGLHEQRLLLPHHHQYPFKSSGQLG